MSKETQSLDTKQSFTEDQTNGSEAEVMSADVSNNIQNISNNSPSGIEPIQLNLDVELPVGSDSNYSVPETSSNTLLPLELHLDAGNSNAQDRSASSNVETNSTSSQIKESESNPEKPLQNDNNVLNDKTNSEVSYEESDCDLLIDFLDAPVNINNPGSTKVEAPTTCLLTGILDEDISTTNEIYAYTNLQTMPSNGIDELDAFIRSIYDVFPEASDSNIEILGDTESTVFEAIITKDKDEAASVNETKRLSIGFFDLKIIEDMTPDGVNNLVKNIYEVLPKKLNEDAENAKTLVENLYDTLPTGIRSVNDPTKSVPENEYDLLPASKRCVDNSYIQVIQANILDTSDIKRLNTVVESDYSTLKYEDTKCTQYEATAFGKSTIYRPMCHHYESVKEWEGKSSNKVKKASCLKTKKSSEERKKREHLSIYEDVAIYRPKKGVTFNEVVEVKEYFVTDLSMMDEEPILTAPKMTVPKMMDPKTIDPKRPKKKLVRKVFGRLLKK